MSYKFINGNGPEGFESGIAAHETGKTRAGEPKGRRLTRNGPTGSGGWEDLLCNATACARMRIKGTFAKKPKPSTSRDYNAKLLVEQIDQALCLISILGVLLVTASCLLAEPPHDGKASHLSARELVEDVARKEKMAREDPRNYYRFVQKEVTPQDTETSIRIETPRGEIGKVISINGNPPSKERCRAETQSLAKLTTDSHVQQRRSQEQKEEADRVNKLMTAVPEAFIFDYQGEQRGSKSIEIRFRPNPRFQPQSHEAMVLKGMQGTLWVDPESHRLVKIKGTLVKDVKFGWGFLATLHRGGHFAMRQSKVPGGSWKQTFLEIDLDGSKLVFGQLRVHFKNSSQSFSDSRILPLWLMKR